MKRVLTFFRILGDAGGLAIMLGGLMIATNNTRATRSAPLRLRKAAPQQPERALNATRAAA